MAFKRTVASLALSCALTLALASQATIAHADEPSSQQLVQQYGGGSDVQGASADYVAPNTAGLPRAGSQLPVSYSLAKWAMPVGDQGKVNACVSWALGYSMAGWYANYRGTPKTFAPMYVYSQIAYPNDGGSTVADAYKILSKQGIVQRGQYPGGDYTYATKPTATQMQQAAENALTAPHWLYSATDGEAKQKPGPASRTAIEAAISSNHPVTLSIPLYDAFYKLNASDSTLVASDIPVSALDYGGHDVLVLGYDAQGVTVQNQWGVKWGSAGYAKLGWDFVEKYSLDATWVWGFARDLAPQVPAAPDQVVLRVNGSEVNISFLGTGDYDDSVRHPVQQYTLTLTGSNGKVITQTFDGAKGDVTRGVSYTNLDPNLTYTARLVATNAIGEGPATTFSFTPSGAYTRQYAGADTPSATMPTGAAISAPSPSTSTPASKPKYTKPGNVRFPSLVVQRTRASKQAQRIVLNWIKPTSLGGSKLSGYTVKVVGAKGAKVKYSRSFNFNAKATGKTFKFTGKDRLPRGLKYRFSIYVKSAAKLSSSGYAWKVQVL